MPRTRYDAAIPYDSPIHYDGDIYINVAFEETATPDDSLTGSAVMNAGLTESATPGDSLASVTTFNASFTESATPGDSLASTANMSVAFTETLTASDALDSIVLAATPESRTYVVGGTLSPTFIKDPDSLLDFSIAWGEWLGSDTIASSAWLLPSGITAYATAQTSTSATIWLSGGGLGGEYRAVNRIVTAAGRRDDRTLTFKIRNR